MSDGKLIALSVVAIIMGASGLGLGIFSAINFQLVEGPQGPAGQDGID